MPRVERKVVSLFISRTARDDLAKRNGNVAEKFLALSQRHLSLYVSTKGKDLSVKIRDNMLEKFNWLSYERKSEGVYPVFEQICADLESWRKVCEGVVGEDGRKLVQVRFTLLFSTTGLLSLPPIFSLRSEKTRRLSKEASK